MFLLPSPTRRLLTQRSRPRKGLEKGEGGERCGEEQYNKKGEKISASPKRGGKKGLIYLSTFAKELYSTFRALASRSCCCTSMIIPIFVSTSTFIETVMRSLSASLSLSFS